MLNEPGNPNIEAFGGAVAQKHHLQFFPVETNHTGSGFRISLARRRTAAETNTNPRKRSFDTGQISNAGDPGKASCLNLRRERIAAEDVRQQRGTAGKKYEENSDALDTAGAHAGTIVDTVSLERFQAQPKWEIPDKRRAVG